MTSAKWTAQDLPRPRRPHLRRHRRQQRHRPRRRPRARPRAGARVVLAVRDTAKGEAAAADDRRATTEVRRARPRRPRLGPRVRRRRGTGDLDVLVNNAGVMAVPERAHRRRLRAAVRHQPPRPLRADQPAAAARHATASSTVASGAHRIGHDPTSTTSTGSAAATSAGAPTASPSSPTCCSRPSSSAASTTAGSTVRALAAHPGYAATNLQRHTGNVAAERADGGRQPACSPRATRWARCRRSTPRRRTSRATPTSAPTASASSAATRRSSAAAARRSDAETARAAVGALRGAHRRGLPAQPGASR